MLDRRVSIPPVFAERSCILVQYRLPLLRHCFVLCYEPRKDEPFTTPESELLAFFLLQAELLADDAVGDPKAFVFVCSGASIRKRPNLHAHVFVIQHRWQKAWLYSVLAAKNISLTVLSLFRKVQAKRPARSSLNSQP
jgi:hypothetical protein